MPFEGGVFALLRSLHACLGFIYLCVYSELVLGDELPPVLYCKLNFDTLLGVAVCADLITERG